MFLLHLCSILRMHCFVFNSFFKREGGGGGGEEGGVASYSRGVRPNTRGVWCFLLHLCFILMRAEVRASHDQENRETYGGPNIAIWCIRLHLKISFWGLCEARPILAGGGEGE